MKKKQNNKNVIIVVAIFLTYMVISSFQKEKYYPYYATIPVYPNNKKEMELVKKEVLSRTLDDIKFFRLTDPGISNAFKEVIDMPLVEMRNIITKHNKCIFFFKYLFNRARPYQVDENFTPLESTTAHTPAYPSGHAFQSFYFAKTMSKKHPHLSEKLWACAERCANVRVKAGVHYPSDNEFSRYLVMNYF